MIAASMHSAPAAASAWLARVAPDHRRLLFAEHLAGAAVVNLVINAGLAWLTFPVTRMPLWGMTSIAGDTLCTGFLLPMLTCLIVGRITRHRVERGHLRALPASETAESFWTSTPTVRRGAVLGILGVAFAALPVVAALHLAGVAEMSRVPFVGFKAGFAVGLGAVLTPPIAWWALVRASRARHAASE
jgi:hypothetical protein